MNYFDPLQGQAAGGRVWGGAKTRCKTRRGPAGLLQSAFDSIGAEK